VICRTNSSFGPSLGYLVDEMVKAPADRLVLLLPQEPVQAGNIFSMQNTDAKDFLKICRPGPGGWQLVFSNDASAAEGFRNPRAVAKPSRRAARIQPAPELWPNGLQLACLDGDNGFESQPDWEICSTLRSALTLL
jgi:hypothetical protein